MLLLLLLDDFVGAGGSVDKCFWLFCPGFYSGKEVDSHLWPWRSRGFWLELVLTGQVFILSFWQESILINFLLDLF